MCVNFIHKWRDLQFKVGFFLRNFSWQFLFTLRVYARNLLRGNCRRNTFRILLWCLASNPVFSSNKPIHYLLDHGDFNGIKTKVMKLESWKICHIMYHIQIVKWQIVNYIRNRLVDLIKQELWIHFFHNLLIYNFD